MASSSPAITWLNTERHVVKPSVELGILLVVVSLQSRPLVDQWDRQILGQVVGVTRNQACPDRCIKCDILKQSKKSTADNSEFHRNLVHFLFASLTAAPGVPGLWPPGPFSPPGCDSAAPPVGPLTSCCLSQHSSVGTRVDAQAPPGSPGDAHWREWKTSTLTWNSETVK